jgi:GDP-mannose 6-dehydrogenase
LGAEPAEAQVRVAVLGVGYVGTVTAACLADAGHYVVGVDPDGTKVRALASGTSPVVEPELDVIVRRAVRQGCLRATDDVAAGLRGAEIAIVCVGTPSKAGGGVDLRHLERAAIDLGEHLAHREEDDYLAIVVRSTVPPGTVSEMFGPLVAAVAGPAAAESFGVAMCPEFLREGSGVTDFHNPPFTVIGSDDERATEVVGLLFDDLPAKRIVTDLRSAEALKYACNSFHAVKIGFANEIGRLLRSLDVDSRVVMEIFVEDTRLNVSAAYLQPGFAFGGSCLPKDLRAVLSLARAHDVDLPMLTGLLRTNELTIKSVVDEVLETGARQIALFGLSFKAETDDLRESPYVELAESLLGKGIDLTIYDPVVRPELLVGANRRFVDERLPHLRRLLADSAADALRGVSAAIVGVSTPEIRDLIADQPPVHIFDLVGTLGPEVESLPGYVGGSW